MTVQEKPQRVWMRIAVMVLCLAMGGARWLEAQTRPSRQPVRPKLSRLQRLRLAGISILVAFLPAKHPLKSDIAAV